VQRLDQVEETLGDVDVCSFDRPDLEAVGEFEELDAE
jgi:hypothetical protein